MSEGENRAFRLWDAPVRIVHWLFVLLLPALWWSAEVGELETHKLFGMIMLGLVLFRLFWGVLGSDSARFSYFVKGPAAIVETVRTIFVRSKDTKPGHNPLGALSVLALLTLLAAQAAFGMFAQDVDGIESGPLSYLVSYEGADAAREWHHSLFDILIILVIIHIAAILFYVFYKRDNLILPMVSGKKQSVGGASELRFAPYWLAALIAAVCAGICWWLWNGAPLP